MTAVGAADAGEAEVQVAAAKKAPGHVADHGSPRTVTTGVALVVGTIELREVTPDGPVQRRLSRLALALAIDKAVHDNRQDDWPGNRMKIKQVRNAIRAALVNDDPRVDDVLDLVTNQNK